MRQALGRNYLAWCFVLALSLLSLLSLRDYGKGNWAELRTSLPSGLVQNYERSADYSAPQERTNVFFLKAHKCASSTVQNILLRFGLERGLSFVLPEIHNYIGNPEMFHPNLINEQYATSNGKYNIFAHHSRFDKEGVRSVMYDDAAYITILRHPAEVYESIFAYYKFEKIFNISFDELLKKPKNIRKLNRRYFNRIGFNQMSFDLGLLEEDFNNSAKVSKFIKSIDEQFDLVMMSEWMEASLVLLADTMNWPLENVVSLKLNSRSPDKIYVMSPIEKQRVVNLNNVDYKLYIHFLNKFKQKIKDYGVDKMKNDMKRLVTLNSQLHFRCVQSLNNKGFGHTQAYKLRNEGDWLCYYAAYGELAFTEHLRNLQRKKIKIITNLDLLLNEQNVL